MSNQFDSLLDFDDTTTTTTTTVKTSTSNGTGDDFDPFGPSPGTDSADLLGDFSITTTTEITNGKASSGLGDDFHLQFEDSTTTTTMSTDAQQTNLLYDLDMGSGSGSANPLYDLDQEENGHQQPANPLYDLSSEVEVNDSSANPLYEFENGTSSHQEVDLLAGTTATTTAAAAAEGDLHIEEQSFGTSNADFFVDQEEEEVQQQQQQSGLNNNVDMLGGTFEDDLMPEQQETTDISYSVAAGADHTKAEEVEEEEEEPQPQQQEVPDQFADDDDVVDTAEQEEEVIQDGRTVSKSSRSENILSDSGAGTQFSQQSWELQKNAQNEADYRGGAQYTDDVRTKFESGPTPTPRKQLDIQQEVLSAEGGVYESEPQKFEQWQNEEEEEEGIYENQPIMRQDVARESDKDIGVELPAVGTASSLRTKFMTGQAEGASPRGKRGMTPPDSSGPSEFVSEPRSFVEKYEGHAESGVFESEPVRAGDMVTSETVLEESLPQQGTARNLAARFKEMETKGSVPVPSAGKREITPDRSTRVEYVSEPRAQVEHYEGRAEAGVFESEPLQNPEVIRAADQMQEELPEQGMARNIAARFKQMGSSESAGTPRGKREITPDTTGRVEYVSEPRGRVEQYEAQVEAGVFENEPQHQPDVIRSDEMLEEAMPERGFTRNVAAKFRELETTAKSPPLSPGQRKEFTPPREEVPGQRQAGVYESTPQVKADVVHATDAQEEVLPERGSAKNIAQRFRQFEAASKSPTSPKPKKEFTPPPADSGVFENQPKAFVSEYNPPPESGIVENQPVMREDVVREAEPPQYEKELPERGMARSLVSRWRQMESESAKVTSPGSSGRVKEFTPPREEPRITQYRSPRTPKTPPAGQEDSSVHPSELPGQYQPQQEPTVFESEPEYRPDAIREADTDWTEGMPRRDTTKKMLAKFRSIQSQASQDGSSGAATTPAKPKATRRA